MKSIFLPRTHLAALSPWRIATIYVQADPNVNTGDIVQRPRSPSLVQQAINVAIPPRSTSELASEYSVEKDKETTKKKNPNVEIKN